MELLKFTRKSAHDNITEEKVGNYKRTIKMMNSSIVLDSSRIMGTMGTMGTIGNYGNYGNYERI